MGDTELLTCDFSSRTFFFGLLPGRLFSVDDFSSAFHRGLLDFSSVDFSSLDFYPVDFSPWTISGLAFHRGLLDFSSVDFSSLDFLKTFYLDIFEEIKTAPNTMLTQGGGDVGLESFVIFIQFCAWDRA